jgi:predicted Zn-dependent protease
VTFLLLSLLLADPVADFNAGAAAEGRGDLAAAASLLDSAQAASPRWGLPKIELAEVLLKQGAVDRALQLLAAAQPLEPQNPRLYHLRGMASEQKGDPRAAESAERTALSLRVDYQAASETLAQALWDEGRKDESVQLWQSLAQSHPEDTAIRAALVDRLSDSGKAVEAEKELRRLAAEQPKNPIWHRRLARTLDGEGLAAEAEDERRIAAMLSGEPVAKRKLRRLPDSRR